MKESVSPFRCGKSSTRGGVLEKVRRDACCCFLVFAASAAMLMCTCLACTVPGVNLSEWTKSECACEGALL
jgi:hypothetical protein